MREEEDNLCCLVLSAKVPCRVALIGHSSPPGILHGLVQPEQLYVCVCVCVYVVCDVRRLHMGVYTRTCIQNQRYFRVPPFPFNQVLHRPKMQCTNFLWICIAG